jgi:hypothetical protein
VTSLSKAITTVFLIAFMVSSSSGEDSKPPVMQIKSVLKSYASTLGCVVRMEDDNILSFDIDGDGKKEFVVLFSLDPGCSGGTATHRSVFAVLEREPHAQVFVRPQQSFPAAPLEGFVQNIDRIFVEDGELWYVGKDFDWSNDARCCPSVPVKAPFYFRDGAWVDSRGP